MWALDEAESQPYRWCDLQLLCEVLRVLMGDVQVVITKDARPCTPGSSDFVSPGWNESDVKSEACGFLDDLDHAAEKSLLGWRGSLPAKGSNPAGVGWVMPLDSESTTVWMTV
jgi:hypothetical protein